MIETHRSFANMWECDENNHMNVQFFVKRFDEATAVYATLCGQVAPEVRVVNHRHVRFYREIRGGESLRITSGHVSTGPHQGRIVHKMFDAISGALCTTALDDYTQAITPHVSADEADLGDALPRGLPDGGLTPFDTAKMIGAGQAIASNYHVIAADDLDPDGNFLSNRIVSMFTDGAPHIWEKAGVTTDWLNANGFGRVAVEMRVTPLAKPSTGSALRMVSRAGGIEGRTIRIDHQIEDIASRRIIATGSARGLVMDLATRKAVHLPDECVNNQAF